MNAQELVKKYGFASAQRIGRWRGETVYAGAMEDPRAAVGLPFFVLEGSSGNARQATVDETFKLMQAFPDGPEKSSPTQDVALDRFCRKTALLGFNPFSSKHS